MEPVDPRIDPQLVPEGSRAILLSLDQPVEYLGLPSIFTPTKHNVITRWTMTDNERAAIAAGEDIFVTICWGTPNRSLAVTVGPCDWREL